MLKKIAFASIIIGLAVSVVSAHAATLFTKDLYFGMKNDAQVTQLQQFLTTYGYYTDPITGNFFSLTQAGVKKFQIAQGRNFDKPRLL
ncbi:MAG: peptidoglycan-binding domain-containing protein [bacterium]|nr:peptidoglycan-binding domain-containing protein [bacterium]